MAVYKVSQKRNLTKQEKYAKITNSGYQKEGKEEI